MLNKRQDIFGVSYCTGNGVVGHLCGVCSKVYSVVHVGVRVGMICNRNESESFRGTFEVFNL